MKEYELITIQQKKYASTTIGQGKLLRNIKISFESSINRSEAPPQTHILDIIPEA